MKNKILMILVCIFSTPVFAQTDMSFLDLFVEPLIGISMGSFDIGNGPGQIDKGSYNLLTAGGRLGLKLGPTFIGFDYYESEPGGSSDVQVSASDRERFPSLHDAKTVSYGPSVGFQYQRAFLWFTYTTESLKQQLSKPESYEHEYRGQGYRVTLDFDLFKNLHAGLFYHNTKMDKYTSSLSTDNVINADLGHNVRAETFGIKISYFFSISQLGKIKNSFRSGY